MAEFLTTAGISASIEDIIVHAKNHLILVSPYLQLSPIFMERLVDANERKVQITIIYRKLGEGVTLSQMRGLKHLELCKSPNLHAKCYFNEHKMVIGSMNFYDYSDRNNREMGILLRKETDADLIEQAMAEYKSIKKASEMTHGKLIYTGLVEPYLTHTNFHLPTLKLALEKEYPNLKLGMSVKRISTEKPNSEVGIEIDHGIIITFSNTYKASKFRKKIPDNILSNDEVSSVWHNEEKKLIINFKESLTSLKISEETQGSTALRFLELIDKLWIYL